MGSMRDLRYFAMVSIMLTSTSPSAGGQIRLSGSGCTPCSGRVEIYHDNKWGTICDDEWGLNDAQVVCRQLDCGSAESAQTQAHFGQGTGPIWLDEVSCSGKERSITNCGNIGFGHHNCNHNEDAGVTCSVRFSRPGISLNPGREVSWGQNVVFTCTISAGRRLSGTFILKKTSGSFRETQSSSTSSATFRISKVNFDHEGSYQCQYMTEFTSEDCDYSSNDVQLLVTVSFPKPSISMNPADEITWRQDVYITCTISTQIVGGTFILQKTSSSFRELQESRTNSVTFRIPQVDFDNEGSYQCLYEKRSSKRTFSSPTSDSVRLSITVRLQQPSISLTSPDGGLVELPEVAEVTKGYSFVVTCSIISRYSEGHFILMHSGSNITTTKPAVNFSASFDFPAVKYEHQGNYSCVYRVTLSSRTFTSAETAPISVDIKMPLSLLISLVSASLLVLIILLSVCLIVRRKIRAKQSSVLVQSRIAFRSGNEYDSSDSQDEEDYVNVDPMETKTHLKVEAAKGGEEESDDYEQPESDGDHDYEDADFANARKACFQEEEETTDDEDNYENINQSFDQQDANTDEESDDEAIYQNF